MKVIIQVIVLEVGLYKCALVVGVYILILTTPQMCLKVSLLKITGQKYKYCKYAATHCEINQIIFNKSNF